MTTTVKNWTRPKTVRPKPRTRPQQIRAIQGPRQLLPDNAINADVTNKIFIIRNLLHSSGLKWFERPPFYSKTI